MRRKRLERQMKAETLKGNTEKATAIKKQIVMIDMDTLNRAKCKERVR